MSIDYPSVARENDIKEFIEKTIEGANRPHDITIYQNLIQWLTDKIFDAAHEMGERKYVVARKEGSKKIAELRKYYEEELL